MAEHLTPCPECRGQAFIKGQPCVRCHATGYIKRDTQPAMPAIPHAGQWTEAPDRRQEACEAILVRIKEEAERPNFHDGASCIKFLAEAWSLLRGAG